MNDQKYKIGSLFDISYGERVIHDKSHLKEGKNIVISSGGENNGLYGFYNKDPHFLETVITIPSTGSVGKAFVQHLNCSIDDNCLVLKRKNNMKKFLTISNLYYVCAILRNESWRFQYGRQVTDARISKIIIDFSNYDVSRINRIYDLQKKYLFS